MAALLLTFTAEVQHLSDCERRYYCIFVCNDNEAFVTLTADLSSATRTPTRLDSVPAAEGDLLVRPDHSGAAAEIVSEFNAPEREKIRNANAIVTTTKRGETKKSERLPSE